MRIILFFLSLAVHADLSNNIDTHKEKYEKLALEKRWTIDGPKSGWGRVFSSKK